MTSASETTYLSLARANEIIAATLAKARELELKPLTVAVLDAGGHLIALVREDAASTLRPQIAIGKAAGALALGVSSRKIADMAAARPSFIASVSSLSPQGIVPAAGGVLIAGHQGMALGAVGVTGDSSDNDEICALHGLKTVSLSALN